MELFGVIDIMINVSSFMMIVLPVRLHLLHLLPLSVILVLLSIIRDL
jgi:hypothetical protein